MGQKKSEIKLEVGTKALLQNADGKFLFLKRNEPYEGEMECSWDIPGGRIKPGETQQQALIRELKEETGLELAVIIGVLAVQDILRVHNRHVVRVTYLAQAKERKRIMLDKKEHSEYKWFTLDELASIQLDMYLSPIITMLKNRFE